jgi:hypothetical protein
LSRAAYQTRIESYLFPALGKKAGPGWIQPQAINRRHRVPGSILRPSVLLPFVSLGKGAADCAAQKINGDASWPIAKRN